MLSYTQYAAIYQAISLYTFKGQSMISSNGYKIKAPVSRLVVKKRANKKSTVFEYLSVSKDFLYIAVVKKTSRYSSVFLQSRIPPFPIPEFILE